MKLSAAITALFLAAGNTAIAAEQRISGAAEALDGDTLTVSGVVVHLQGIDAPEPGQSCLRDQQKWQCGAEAKAVLAQLVENHSIKCTSRQQDDRGVMLALCDRNGLDLGLVMVEAGLATALADAPPTYLSAEAIRKERAVGLWAGEFQQPALWRAENPEPAATQRRAERPASPPVAAPSRRAAETVYRNHFGCAIKGNRSRRGEWIYHLPGRPYYDQTRPEELFCTEAEARRAGYRRSKA
ncbi:MAG: thermonuclease family protein [Alteripontixanthobacter sp.]